MKTKHILSYIHALRPILYIQSNDFHAVDEILRDVVGNADVREFCEGLGSVDFRSKSLQAQCTLQQFLAQNKDEGYDKEAFLVLKDVHDHLKDVHGLLHAPDVIALLKYIAERTLYTECYQQTVIIVSCECVIPKELEHFITIIPQELPSRTSIENTIRMYADELKFTIDEKDVGDLALELKGFSDFQIKQVLDLAYVNGGMISSQDKGFILSEKKQIIHKSGLLEYIDSDAHIAPIGGLNALKEWLLRKAQVFHNLSAALKSGVDMPKGMLVVGFPGCGKSLAAKTTAALFKVPLLRLDVGKILGKYVGESEQNMRAALAQAEAISPCVLWVDEVEKAFAGSTGNNTHEVTARLIGQFLTWMQEKTSTVFVVATANDLEHLPTEFLRKGRFDEIFSVDLPDLQERLQILKIHLKKRNHYDVALDLSSLAKNTDGFSGADLEAIVASAVEDFFLNSLGDNTSAPKTLSSEDLERARKAIKPLSEALKTKFDAMKKKLKEYAVREARGDRDVVLPVVNEKEENQKAGAIAGGGAIAGVIAGAVLATYIRPAWRQ